VDDLHHRAPLVGAARSEVFDHVDVGGGRQRPVRFVRGRAAKIVEAVGEHADLDAAPLTLNPLSSRACCTCAAVLGDGWPTITSQLVAPGASPRSSEGEIEDCQAESCTPSSVSETACCPSATSGARIRRCFIEVPDAAADANQFTRSRTPVRRTPRSSHATFLRYTDRSRYVFVTLHRRSAVAWSTSTPFE
jgi:hypothetical protein